MRQGKVKLEKMTAHVFLFSNVTEAKFVRREGPLGTSFSAFR